MSILVNFVAAVQLTPQIITQIRPSTLQPLI